MKNIGIFLVVSSFFMSCNSENANNSEQINSSKIEVANDIINSNIEDLKKTDIIDKEKVAELILNIDAFAKENPKNSKTPKHLELKAKYLGAMGKHKESIEIYNTIYKEYGNYVNRADALFMMAFKQENDLHNKEIAKDLYRKFLAEFPNDEFAKDAKFAIKNIDKSPEELLEMFKKNK